MSQPLRALSPDVLAGVWIDVLHLRLRAELAAAATGHCLRVSDLPRAILEPLAARLSADRLPAVEVYLVDRESGPEPWRARVHRVVERRNAEEGVVLALFPPDLQLAAGDSVDVSTFRALASADVPRQVEAALIERLPESLRRPVRQVLAYVDLRRWPISGTARLEFLATVVAQDRDDPAVVGASLYTLGLIPDFALFNRPEEVSYRLGQRNIPVVQQLGDAGTTPMQRVLHLSLSDEAFRTRLLAFFRDRPPERVEAWGQVVAETAAWRDLALDCWPIGEGAPPPASLRIDVEPLQGLPRRSEDGLLLFQPAAGRRAEIVWQTTPPPMDVSGLAYFRIEVVSADRVVVWESPLLRISSGRSARRRRTIRDLPGLDSGIHFFRVIALDAAGDPLSEQTLRDPQAGVEGKRTNESEDFLLLTGESGGEIEIEAFEPVLNTVVRSYPEAELLGRQSAASSGWDPNSVRTAALEWTTPVDARGEVAVAAIRFDVQRQYSLRLSQRLRKLELVILDAPEMGGHLLVDLGPNTGHVAPSAQPLAIPPELVRARRTVFTAIQETAVGGGGYPVVALADLCAIAPQIEQYAESYRAWLDSEDSSALRLDVVLAMLPEQSRAALVAPTHPLRLLWALQAQQLARTWTREVWLRGDHERYFLEAWQRSLAPQGLPLILVLSADEGYLDAGPLPGGWGAYLPPHSHDSRALLALLRARLGAGAAHQSEADVPPALLTDKLELFLRQHPYTPAMVINVINPGDAALVVDALVGLEGRRDPELPPIRYEVRLFSDAASSEAVGSAFRELLNADRQISESADRLTAPGRSFLFPKLSWSRNSLREFLSNPERFPAHVTLLLDAFSVVLRLARPEPGERSSYVHGLVQEAPRRFVGRGRAFTWIRRPAPTACPDLSDAPGRSGLLAGLVAAIGALEGRLLAPNADTTSATAVAALDLLPSDQSLLFSAHAISTWVITLDPHLGLDYFDAPRRPDRPGYLLDFTPEFVAAGGRQLLLTTRVGEEISRLMAPAAAQLGLDTEGLGAPLLLEVLRSLSGRLALRLLSAPSQIQGALGMALSRLFLEAFGLLDEALIIPLDAHPELAERQADPAAPRLRGDLLVVSADPRTRQLDLLLVEAKCYAGTGLSADLRESISAQLHSSANAISEAFDPAWRDPDRVDRVIQSWRLAGVLGFYLDRAARYGLITPEVCDLFRHFLVSLDAGYSVSVRKMGLVFHLEALNTTLDQADPEVPIWIIGRDEIGRVVTEALREFTVREQSQNDFDNSVRASEQRRATTDPRTWEDVRASFGMLKIHPNPSYHAATAPDREAREPRPAALQGPGVADQTKVLAEPTERPAAPETSDVIPSDSTAILLADVGTPPEYAVLLGDTRASPQFGILGSIAAEPWRRVALDLNGCNTLSIFGVQGSGKSYTVGSILEMALQPLRGLNLLPEPLAAVVFHYHQTQDYPPEFVSMDEANDDPLAVEMLAAWGAAPAALSDVMVLTTADTVVVRHEQFPRARVEPIAFSSAELTVADWRFLMGATGNDALYLKLVNEVMREHRTNLTLDAIRHGLADAPLNDSHRALALTRLDFASRFIDDGRSLRSLLRPGRLLVVDLRDEFVEKDQALGLFVTMLNVFSGAGLGVDPFNKLIVFDEAHKYMGGSVIGQVVEVIREMRHKGVSVVIASQDPVNVPPAVIELSSAVFLHRFNSPNWLRHIQKSLASLADLTPSMLAALAPGDAFAWANRATDPTFMRRAVKLHIRPRATKHGGATRTAVEG